MPKKVYFIMGAASLLVCPLVASVSLSEALERALETDPRLREIDASLAADREDGEQILGTRRPTVDAYASADWNRTHSSRSFFGDRRETFPSYQGGVEARQPLYRMDWSQRGVRARELDALAGANWTASRQAYFQELAERYLAVLAAKENLRLAEAEAEVVGMALRDTRSRFEAETVPGTDLREAEARDDLARARLLAAEQAVDDARERLEEAIGPVDSLPVLSPDADLLRFLDGTGVDWAERALEASPLIESARAAALVARGEREARRSERFPTVDLVGGVRRSDTSESDIGDRSTDARIGLEVTVSLYRGGVLDSSSRQARARQRAAEARLESSRRELNRQVRDAWRAIEVSAREVEAFRAVVRSSEAAEEATANGYEAGTRTILDLLNARSATVAARRDLANARFTVLLGQIRLYQLAGLLTMEKLEQLDTFFEDA